MGTGNKGKGAPLGCGLDELLWSVSEDEMRDTLRRLWLAMGKGGAEVAEHVKNIKGLPQERWIRASCEFLFPRLLQQWSAGGFKDGGFVGIEAKRRNEAMESFLRYAEESLLVRVTWCLIEEVSDIREAERNRGVRGSDESSYRRRSTTDDLMLLMEALDGLEPTYLDAGSELIPLVEWVAMAQRAKFEQLFDTWVERQFSQHATEYRSTLKQQLLHWMMELDEPDYVRFWDFMESLGEAHFRGGESESPLQTLLDVNHHILFAKEKLDFVEKYEPEKWIEELRRREEEHENFCKDGTTHDWTWDKIRDKHFCDERTVNLAEGLEGLLKTELPADALSEFRRKYKKNKKCSGDKKTVKQQENELLILEDELKKVLRVICWSIMQKDGKPLSRTQLVAIFALVRGSTLLNVETGEGKTAISGCCAAFKVYCGYMVDMASSNKTLAKQLHAELNNFLKKLFDEDMCHVLSGDSSKGFDKPVVFGTFSQFISANLAYTNCGAKSNAALETRRSRLCYLLVDEADQPMLNDFAHVVYLSSPWLPGRRVTPGLVNLMEKVHAQEDDTDSLKQAYWSGVGSVCKTVEDEDEAMSKLRLNRYIHSARLASNGLRDGVDYVAAEGGTGIPYNADTGELQRGVSWQDGLSTFVSLKNGGLWNDEGLCPVFCSYFSFLDSYRSAMGGMTGTVGCWRSQRVLEEVYGLRVMSIPRAFRRRFSLEEPRALKTEKERDGAVAEKAVEKALEGRPVLVLMQYPSEAKTVFKKTQERAEDIGRNNLLEVVSYLDDGKHHETPDIKNATGNIIVVSTALAGRGKDFKLNDRQKERGGLFVILGYSATQREMTQAYGRAARQTDRGEAVSIVLHESGDYYQAVNEVMFREKLRLQKMQAEDSRRIDLEKRLRGVYLKAMKESVDDNTGFAHELRLCCGEELCGCQRYDESTDPRNCRRIANFLGNVMETRFGLWMNEQRDKISKASRSVKDSTALLEKMRREVVFPLHNFLGEEQPNILKFLRTSDEALGFCLSVCRVEVLSKLWEKPDSKLQSFGKTCTFGTIPYYVGYSYLKRAEHNEKQRQELFGNAADCFWESANSFERWAGIFEHVNEGAEGICPGAARREVFDDRLEIMRVHHQIAMCLAGTRNWNPTMFEEALKDITTDPVKISEDLFKKLLNGSVTQAKLKEEDEAQLKERLRQLKIRNEGQVSDDDISRLARTLIEKGNLDYGLNLHTAVREEAERLADRLTVFLGQNKPTGGNTERVERLRDELWKELTDPIEGVIQSFGVRKTFRHLSDEHLEKELGQHLKERDNKVIKRVTDVCAASMGLLRSEQFQNFKVSMKELDNARKTYRIGDSACISRGLKYFCPLGQDQAVVIKRDSGLVGKILRTFREVYLILKPILDDVFTLFPIPVSFWYQITKVSLQVAKLYIKLLHRFARGGSGRCPSSQEEPQRHCCLVVEGFIRFAFKWGISASHSLARAALKASHQIEELLEAADKGVKTDLEKVIRDLQAYAVCLRCHGTTKKDSCVIVSNVVMRLYPNLSRTAEDKVRTAVETSLVKALHFVAKNVQEEFEATFLDPLRSGLSKLRNQSMEEFQEFRSCLKRQFNNVESSVIGIFRDIRDDLSAFCTEAENPQPIPDLITLANSDDFFTEVQAYCRTFQQECRDALAKLLAAPCAQGVEWASTGPAGRTEMLGEAERLLEGYVVLLEDILNTKTIETSDKFIHFLKRALRYHAWRRVRGHDRDAKGCIGTSEQ
ncbi:unnamed protein product [Trypanosoma congolense IL3000]|uniref:WGS project CAEQ00000000 data, annotated contig 1488 n=1 Tax=Trypanosoma congolense (strain IL3000) TaxID=1068625 RepID=F9W6L2_TRYCI|nr:unnamed protein product [Trypanosoma congolense IL3000]